MDAAEKLLEMGAEFGNQAIADALDFESKEYLVQRLLKRGADPNAEHNCQGNMLQLAIYKKCKKETISLVVGSGGGC